MSLHIIYMIECDGSQTCGANITQDEINPRVGLLCSTADKLLAERGWVTKKINGEKKHYCADCVEKGRS